MVQNRTDETGFVVTEQAVQALLADEAYLPRPLRERARDRLLEALRARRAALLPVITGWLETLGPLLKRKSVLECARRAVIASDARTRAPVLKRLREIWATRRAGSLRVDPAVRRAAAQLDVLDRHLGTAWGWRQLLPIAAANVDVDGLALDTIALSAEERRDIGRSQDRERENGSPLLRAINDYRAMLGRTRVAPGYPAHTIERREFLCLRACSVDEALDRLIMGAEHDALIDPEWTCGEASAVGLPAA